MTASNRNAPSAQRESSLVHTQHITRPETPDRVRWIRQVEKATDAHRVLRAKHHWRRASELKAERLAAGRSTEEAEQGARWHRRRAYGQIDRFLAVLDCGVTKFWLVCEACGRAKEKARQCRITLVCVSCRGYIGQEKRSRFKRARERALARANAFGLLESGRHGVRWSEKLLTLTMPHLTEHGPAERIRIMFRAVALFRKALKRWLEPSVHSDLVAWFRTFEWTPGADGRGHPHFHWWLLCPYLDRAVILEAWAQALRTAGVRCATKDTVIVFIQQVHDGEGAAYEVIKYLTKDILPDRQFVSPEVFGEVYAALDTRRITQSSKRFFKNIDDHAVCECGASDCFKRTNTPPESKSAGAVQAEVTSGDEQERR